MKTMPFAPTSNTETESIMEIKGVMVRGIRFNRATRDISIDYTEVVKTKPATKGTKK
jgi:hypothetical protein